MLAFQMQCWIGADLPELIWTIFNSKATIVLSLGQGFYSYGAEIDKKKIQQQISVTLTFNPWPPMKKTKHLVIYKSPAIIPSIFIWLAYRFQVMVLKEKES